MNFSALFPSWLANIPFDWIVFVALLFLLTFDALRSGPWRACVLAIAMPLSTLFESLLAHTAVVGNTISSLSSPAAQCGVFVALFVVSYVLINRIIGVFGNIAGGLLFSLLASVSATIVTIVTLLQVSSVQTLWHFSPQTQALFGTPVAFVWIVGAYVALAFVRS